MTYLHKGNSHLSDIVFKNEAIYKTKALNKTIYIFIDDSHIIYI